MTKGIPSSALVAGFDPVARVWVREPEASGCGSGRPLVRLPRLDGTLCIDPATRDANTTDIGNIVHLTPGAVLRARSVQDIREMIRFCREHGIKVAARGQGHTTHGQSLTCGLVIENGALNTIHSIGPEGADVDAGVLWKDLIVAAIEHGLTPPVITGYTKLSVGGTLSVGGISPRYDGGAQVDRVQKRPLIRATIHRTELNPTPFPA